MRIQLTDRADTLPDDPTDGFALDIRTPSSAGRINLAPATNS